MLVQLTVENFRSFRAPTTLSFRALPGVAHPEGQVVEVPGIGPVLRTVAFYGANASGKTNLLRAVNWAARLMAKGVPVGERVPDESFKLDGRSKEPTRVALVFVDGGGRPWSYSLACAGGEVVEEWLAAWRDGDFEEVFMRERGPRSRPEVRWGTGLQVTEERAAFLRFVAEGTRPEQPLMAELRARNAEEVESVQEWAMFTDLVQTEWEPSDTSVLQSYAFASLASFPEYRAWALGALRVSGAQVDSFVLETTDERLREAWNEGEEFEYSSAKEIFSTGGNRVRFRVGAALLDWEDLSQGTLRLIELGEETSHWADRGARLFDELERSLHPKLSRWAVRDWLDRRVDEEPPYCQLLFTTHELHLFDESLLGRDAFFFAEKRPDGGSFAYPLSDFEPAQLDALKADLAGHYLQGRFGGVPSLRPPPDGSAR